MKKGYYKINAWGKDGDHYAIIDGVKYSFEEYKHFVREILYMMIMDGEVPIYPLWDGIITSRRIEHALYQSSARILRAAGWKRAE